MLDISWILFALLASAPTAAASPERRQARLVYSRDPGLDGCPTERQLKDRVAARLGYDPWVEESTTLILATMKRAGAGLSGLIRIERMGAPAGERVLSASECMELSSAMELALALAIDPLVGMPGRKPLVEERKPPAPLLQSPPPPLVESPPWTTHVLFGPLVALGPSPGFAPGLELQARLQRGALSFGAEGRVLLPATVNAEGGTVEIFPTTGGVSACGHASVVMGCAFVAAGVLRVTGRQFDESHRVLNPYASIGARFAAELPARGDYGLRLQADAAVPVVRTRVTVNGINVWRSPDVSVSVGLLAVRHFW